MNDHGLTSTTRSRSSSTNWAGISSASKNRSGRPSAGRARHTHAQSGDQTLVVQCSQSSLQPTPIPDAEPQLGRIEILPTVPNCAVGRAVDNQIGEHTTSLVADL